jgi:hypothetical protein
VVRAVPQGEGRVSMCENCSDDDVLLVLVVGSRGHGDGNKDVCNGGEESDENKVSGSEDKLEDGDKVMESDDFILMNN